MSMHFPLNLVSWLVLWQFLLCWHCSDQGLELPLSLALVAGGLPRPVVLDILSRWRKTILLLSANVEAIMLLLAPVCQSDNTKVGRSK